MQSFVSRLLALGFNSDIRLSFFVDTFRGLSTGQSNFHILFNLKYQKDMNMNKLEIAQSNQICFRTDTQPFLKIYK